MSRGPRFDEAQLRAAVAESRSWAEALRRLGYRSAGGNWKTLKKYAAKWRISTEHFDPDASRRAALIQWRGAGRPLAEVMVEGSTYSRASLKDRLFNEGIKDRRCEQCGQEETWRGRRMSLILDHINGVADDHRLENLRVLCPNCAATLETHCSRKNRLAPMPRECLRCGAVFFPDRPARRYCSAYCGQRWIRSGGARLDARRADRPAYLDLIREIEQNGYLATGRKYGVSDNAIRKWVKFYEREVENRRGEQAA